MHCCRTRGVTYCFCRCWSTTFSRTWTDDTARKQTNKQTQHKNAGSSDAARTGQTSSSLSDASPAVSPPHTSSGKSPQTQSTPSSRCQGFRTCGSGKRRVNGRPPAPIFTSRLAREPLTTHRSNSRVMMRKAHFLHFHHASSGRSSSSTSKVSCHAHTRAH